MSDRTACHFASGKPSIVQSTDFAHRLPTGEGLLRFETVQEAVDAVRAVESDYERHAAPARRIAERHFDSRRVLGSLVDRVGL